MFEKKPVAVKFQKHQDVPTAVAQQMKEEIGDQILTEAHLTMLKQKYGLVPAKFTGTETNVIVQAARKAA